MISKLKLRDNGPQSLVQQKRYDIRKLKDAKPTENSLSRFGNRFQVLRGQQDPVVAPFVEDKWCHIIKVSYHAASEIIVGVKRRNFKRRGGGGGW